MGSKQWAMGCAVAVVAVGTGIEANAAVAVPLSVAEGQRDDARDEICRLAQGVPEELVRERLAGVPLAEVLEAIVDVLSDGECCMAQERHGRRAVMRFLVDRIKDARTWPIDSVEPVVLARVRATLAELASDEDDRMRHLLVSLLDHVALPDPADLMPVLIGFLHPAHEDAGSAVSVVLDLAARGSVDPQSLRTPIWNEIRERLGRLVDTSLESRQAALKAELESKGRTSHADFQVSWAAKVWSISRTQALGARFILDGFDFSIDELDGAALDRKTLAVIGFGRASYAMDRERRNLEQDEPIWSELDSLSTFLDLASEVIQSSEVGELDRKLAATYLAYLNRANAVGPDLAVDVAETCAEVVAGLTGDSRLERDLRSILSFGSKALR